MKALQLFLLAMLFTFGLSACEQETALTIADEPDPTLLMSVEIDGKELLLPEGKDGYISTATTERSVLSAGCLEKQGMQLAKGQTNLKSFKVVIQKKLTECATGCEQLADLFGVRTYTYASNSTTEADGVVISYRDSNGTLWSTDMGTADQTGSNFEVVAHEDMDQGRSRKRTQAVFNCKLYNGSGGVLVLTNGRIASRSLNCSNLK